MHIPVVGGTVSPFMAPADTDTAASRAADSLAYLPTDTPAAAEKLHRRRAEMGVAYFAFGANVADTFAPLVAELARRRDSQGVPKITERVTSPDRQAAEGRWFTAVEMRRASLAEVQAFPGRPVTAPGPPISIEAWSDYRSGHQVAVVRSYRRHYGSQPETRNRVLRGEECSQRWVPRWPSTTMFRTTYTEYGGAEDLPVLVAELQSQLAAGAQIVDLQGNLADSTVAADLIADFAAALGHLDILICNHAHGGDQVGLGGPHPLGTRPALGRQRSRDATSHPGVRCSARWAGRRPCHLDDVRPSARANEREPWPTRCPRPRFRARPSRSPTR